jgi:hypothetical protein
MTVPFHGGGPGSEKVVIVTVKEPGNPGIRRLPFAQGSREIDDHLTRRWTVLLCEASDVFYKLHLIALWQESLTIC